MTMRSKQWWTKASRSPNSSVNNSLALPTRPGRARQAIKLGPGKRIVKAKVFVSPMRCAIFSAGPPPHDGHIVTFGQLVLFSTETGNAWLLDPADRLAARLA